MICDNLTCCIKNELSPEHGFQCCNHRESCIKSSDTRAHISCEENKKIYSLENTEKNHVISYRMDGGVILTDKTVPEGIRKCDFLFLINSKDKDAILIELKGKDIRSAFEQIASTLDLYKSLFSECAHVYARAVVTSTVPKLKATPEYVKMTKLVKQYHGNVKVKGRRLEEKDSDLAVQ